MLMIWQSKSGNTTSLQTITVANTPVYNYNNTPNYGDFISCECPELQTWHGGRVEHKLNCSKFWSINPGRTKEELLRNEGF